MHLPTGAFGTQEQEGAGKNRTVQQDPPHSSTSLCWPVSRAPGRAPSAGEGGLWIAPLCPGTPTM